MDFTIRNLEKKDYKKAVEFAIKGMHFDHYVKNPFILKLYGDFFFYQELGRATQVLACYDGEKLLGVLLAEMKGEKKRRNIFSDLYVKTFQALQKVFFREGADPYDCANREMLQNFKKRKDPDGEIVFLAADPEEKVKGVGTALIKALEEREKGKSVFLFTDDGCSYPFYDKRGFKREEERDIVLAFGKREVPLRCFLYAKEL